MPLGSRDTAAWCADVADVARGHGWHANDAVFFQFGRFCVYLRGPEHHKLLHPVVLAPKQDFLSLVPIACPAGSLTYVDAQAATDDVALDRRVVDLAAAIYRFANSCEQVRTKPLPPAPLPECGLPPADAAALEKRVTEKVQRLQDLADSTTRMLSAVFNSVSPQIVLDGPVAEMSAALEDLVGSHLADTGLRAAGRVTGPEMEMPFAALAPEASPAASAGSSSDGLREIWNGMATIRDVVQARLATAEKQRRLSAAAEAIQGRVIRIIEAGLPCPEAPADGDGAPLDDFSEAVVVQVNFGRLRQAVEALPALITSVFNPDGLRARAGALEAELADSVSAPRARALREETARISAAERAVDRGIDRLLETVSDPPAMSEHLRALEEQLAVIAGAEEAQRLIAPLRQAAGADEPDPQAIRDNGIGLLLALSSRSERRIEDLLTGKQMPEGAGLCLHEMSRVLTGIDIADALLATAGRIREHLASDPVPADALLADKQILWGLAYEIVNWVETARVADAVAANTQILSQAQGTFGSLCLANGDALADLVERSAGMRPALEETIPVVAEAPVLVSLGGELLVPPRTHKVIGGITDSGTFRLSRQVTRWHLAEAAEVMACSDGPAWIVFHSALGAACPAPGAVLDALECARSIAQAGGHGEVWCGVLSHPVEGDGPAGLSAYRPDQGQQEAVRAAARACDGLLAEFDAVIDARLEELESKLRATGYAPALLIAEYRAAAGTLKDAVRAFAQERLPALASPRWLARTDEEIAAFVRFAARALQDAQRQAARARQNGTRSLIAALYDIDDRRALARHLLRGAVRDAAFEERLLAPGLVEAVDARIAHDGCAVSAALPLHPEALPEARRSAWIEACAGPDADDEQARRAQVLLQYSASLFGGAAEPGSGSALLLDLLAPVREPLFARDRGRPVLGPEAFDSFTASLERRRKELLRYLAGRPEDRLADAVFLALIVRGMEGRRGTRAPLWEPLASALRMGVSLCGQPVSDLVQLSDAEEAARLFERVRSGELLPDLRLAARLAEDVEKELGIALESASRETLACVRDDILALLHRNLLRQCERLQPERDLFLRLAAGALSEEERAAILSSGTGDRRRRRPQRAAAPADPEEARARLAESARRFAECEHLASTLAPYAGDTTEALYPFVFDVLADRSPEIVRPSLNGMAALPQLLAGDLGSRRQEPEAPAAAPEPAPVIEASGPVAGFLEEFGHLGTDALAADLVEAALVLFPTEDHARTALAGNRKQVLDAILAREFPGVLKSTRMQIVVATEPRGLRLHDISDLTKLVSEGGATPAEIRSLLRSM